MGVVDRVDEDDGAIRWAAVHEASGPGRLLVEMDGAAAALSAARVHFGRFADVCRGKAPLKLGRRSAPTRFNFG